MDSFDTTITLGYSPLSNGLSERMIKNVLDKFSVMLEAAHLTSSYPSKAVLHAAYLDNRTVNSVLGTKTPYEVLLREDTDNADIKVFNGTVFVHTHN